MQRLPVDLGLHLNFTEPLPGNRYCQPLARLLGGALMRALEQRVITAEIERQLSTFEAVIGAAPDYVDGHQHVHQLPVIRDCLLAVLRRRYPERLPWLRSTLPAPGPVGGNWRCRLKARLIAALGGSALNRSAGVLGFRMNRHLLGVYDFTGGEPGYSSLLGEWLSHAASDDLLMCHPAGFADDSLAFGPQRFAEYRVLSGGLFVQLLDCHGLSVGQLAGGTCRVSARSPAGA